MSPDQWRGVQFFKREEFLCPHCGIEDMRPAFMLALDNLRMRLNIPIVISSGYRCPQHNRVVSETGLTGPHTTGNAADIRCSGIQAYSILGVAMRMGFEGIGVKQKGDMGARFLHLDNVISELRPRVWSY